MAKGTEVSIKVPAFAEGAGWFSVMTSFLWGSVRFLASMMVYLVQGLAPRLIANVFTNRIPPSDPVIFANHGAATKAKTAGNIELVTTFERGAVVKPLPVPRSSQARFVNAGDAVDVGICGHIKNKTEHK